MDASFIPGWTVFLQFTLATVVIAITPGPDMTLFVGRAIAEGRAAGVACMLGASTGCLIHTALVSLGLSALIVASPQAFFALKVAGAGYLVWLAVQAIGKGSAFSPDTAARPARSLARNWARGVVVNLLNPKVILFFMTFLPQFVSAADPAAPARLVFLGFLFILISAPINLAFVLMAGGLAGLLRHSPRVTRIVDYLFAGVFSLFALKILSAQTR